MEEKSAKKELEGNWDLQLRELRERLIFLAEDIAPSRGKYEYLESQTGISAARWQNLFLRRLMPTVEMILAILRFDGRYTDWLLTGSRAAEQLGLQDAPRPQALPDAIRWDNFLKMQEHLARKQQASARAKTAS